MDTKYWIIDDKLIFKPEFNEELEEYYNVIGKYNTLIFSNYDDPEITMKQIINMNLEIIKIIKDQNLIKK